MVAEAVVAQVVVASLQDLPPDGASELLGHPGSHERQVSADELVLQRQRRGGDHDSLAGSRSDGGRYQVGQRFAHAGACLAQQRAPVSHRVVHRGRHLVLAGSLLTATGKSCDHLAECRSGAVGTGCWGKVPRLVGHLLTLLPALVLPCAV